MTILVVAEQRWVQELDYPLLSSTLTSRGVLVAAGDSDYVCLDALRRSSETSHTHNEPASASVYPSASNQMALYVISSSMAGLRSRSMSDE